MNRGSETDLVRAVLDTLLLDWRVVCWRNNTGQKGRVRFGLGNGSADIIGIVTRTGRFFALEAKVGKNGQSEDQKEWQAQVTKAGGYYAVVRSVDDALRAVTKATSG